MPTPAEQIETIRDQTLALLVDITANPKPSYSRDGVSYSHTEYLAELKRTLEWCKEQLSAFGQDVGYAEHYGF